MVFCTQGTELYSKRVPLFGCANTYGIQKINKLSMTEILEYTLPSSDIKNDYIVIGSCGSKTQDI